MAESYTCIIWRNWTIMLKKLENIFTIPQEIAISFFITTEGRKKFGEFYPCLFDLRRILLRWILVFPTKLSWCHSLFKPFEKWQAQTSQYSIWAWVINSSKRQISFASGENYYVDAVYANKWARRILHNSFLAST